MSREEKLENEIKGLRWEAVVINLIEMDGSDNKAVIETSFDKIEPLLHKLKLDLMVNLKNNIRTPIQIKITKIERKKNTI